MQADKIRAAQELAEEALARTKALALEKGVAISKYTLLLLLEDNIMIAVSSGVVRDDLLVEYVNRQ